MGGRGRSWAGEAGLLNGICIHSEINWFKTNDANRKARQP